ncbi:MAG: class I SAM-dependent rRNA methyltransferase [Holophagales bacterium]|nr:class I SAM-dependent rRNA methyltransferase [Holophagales bacterium]
MTIDSWYRKAPDQSSRAWQKLQLSRVHTVDHESLAEAEKLLIEDRAMLVSPETKRGPCRNCV